MRPHCTIYALLTAIPAAALLQGCLSTQPPAPSPAQPNGAQVVPAAAAQGDTTALPRDKFTVQVGAFQSQQSADKTANLAGDRYTRSVYTFFDAEGKFFKVYIGVFDTKEDARRFRDRMAQQYPEDYRDAWVAELKK